MIFKINQALPIKYVLGVHTALPKYPTEQDFMFDVAAHLVRVTEVKSKDWDPTDIKFSTKTLKYVFGDKMESEEFKTQIKSLLKILIDNGSLTKKGEFIFVPEKEFSKYYNIL
jgi:hypothetical protein